MDIETLEQQYRAIPLRDILTQLDAALRGQAELRELLREAYPYLPYAVSLAEELAEMFPDIARPQDTQEP